VTVTSIGKKLPDCSWHNRDFCPRRDCRAPRGTPGPRPNGKSARSVVRGLRGHRLEQSICSQAPVRAEVAASAAGPRGSSGPSSTTSFAPPDRAFSPFRCGTAGRTLRLTIGVEPRRRESRRRGQLILATTKVEHFDRFLKTFSTKGAQKRKEHGSKGSTVFRDPNEDDRVWVLFDWDEKDYQDFLSDPEVPAIFQEAGVKGKPQAAEPGGQYDA
jgi:hypothetical protein